MGRILSLCLSLVSTAVFCIPATSPLALAEKVAQTVDCATHLATLTAGHDTDAELSDLRETLRNHGPGTLREVSKRKGRHGGELTLLENEGQFWGTQHQKTPRAPEGDPRWMGMVLGKRLSWFLGFRKVDANHLLVPDANELNGAITKINAWLNRKYGPDNPYLIHVKFYEQLPAKSRVQVYNDTFREEFGIPLSLDLSHRIHDLSFHTGAIFLPKDALERGALFAAEVDRLAGAYAEKYDSEVRKAVGKPAPPEMLNALKAMLRLSATLAIDVGTGTVTISYLEHQTGHAFLSEQDGRPLTKPLRAIQGLRFTPSERYLDSLLDGMKFWQGQVNQDSRITTKASLIIAQFNKSLPARKLKQIQVTMDAFLEDYYEQRAEQAPELDAPSPLDLNQMCKEVSAKIAAVREAVSALQRKK